MNASSRRHRKVTITVLGMALTGALCAAPPAQAADPLRVTVEGMNLDRNGTAVVNDLETERIAPGLTHVEWERLGPDGWQQINVLKAELGDDTVKMKYLSPDRVSGDGATVTEMTEAQGAVGGVNLDRFDINNSTAAAGWGIRDGEIVKSGNPDASASVGMTKDGLGALVNLALKGSAVLPGGDAVAITGVNVSAMPSDGVSLYNQQWGEYSRARAISNPAAGVEVEVAADGTVTGVHDTVREGELPAGVQSLVAVDGSAAGKRLAQLQVGDEVTISYGVDEANLDVAEAGGAWHQLVRDGAPVPFNGDEAYFSGVNPRTMIGFSEDRRTAYFVVVDGRTGVAKGMGFDEMQRLMLDLGVDDAINADGGGSSQMNVRRAGAEDTSIVNSPSDGFERHDGDGMGLVLAQPGSGTLEGYAVEPASQVDDADRVFTGLHRTLVGRGHDETLSPVSDQSAAAPSTWNSSDAQRATVKDGLVRGREAGRVTIRARNGVALGSTELQVLGAPIAIESNHNVVNLERTGSSETLAFTGRDAQGFTAPVEAADLKVDNPRPDVFRVEPTEDGRFTVTAIGDEGAATLTFRNGDIAVEVAVAVPLEVKLIDDFSDVSGWSTAHDRAPKGSLEQGEGHEGSASVRLNYDFTESTGTRGRYAVAPGAVPGGSGGVDIPGRPQKLSVWIKGDGNGSLLRLQVMQANGVRNWLDGVDEATGEPTSLYATWTGWERKDFVVPSSFSFPLKLERIRILETNGVKQYKGSMEFSKIYAYLPPEGVKAPAVTPVHDPVVTTTGDTDDAPLRVAVMSDAQFVARDPESGAVEGARDALREIVAADPDVMVINGDFVDEASPADFDLARRILDEELADATFPWYYVPGNHEVMGGAIENFKAEFGDTNHTFDLRNTRFITLNTATGKLGSDFAQIRELRAQLDDAAKDPKVTGVLVFQHHPTNDPLPTKGSQVTDRNEAELQDDWLTEFRETSGKSIGFVGSHVGVFHATSQDGVPYLVNGNAGKGPASTPQDGGFTGWTMLGIDPEEGRWDASPDRGAEWLDVETRTRVDSLTVQAPTKPLTVGERFDTAPVVLQDDTRKVPVAWPVSHRWSGTEGIFVGEAGEAPAGAFAAIDPATQEVTALRAGSGTLTLAVNDAEESFDITVAGGEVNLTGEAVFGAELTAVPGDWAKDATLTHAWLRDGQPIEGSGATHRVGAADIGHRITAEVTVSGEGRAPVTVSATSDVVRSATQEAPEVRVSGEPVVGGTLTADAGRWADGTALTFEWMRDGAVLEGATSSALRLTAADLGATMSVRVTGHLAGHDTASATSTVTAPVTDRPGTPEPQPVPDVVTSKVPAVKGRAVVGKPLQATTPGWESGARFTYQWMRAGKPIAGATGRSYRPTARDRGKRLSVQVLGAKAGLVAAVRESSATGAVARGKLAPSRVRVLGKPQVGQRLQVRTGAWSGASKKYTWLRGGKVVRTTTKPTYRVRPKDAGKKLSVRVTLTRPGYAKVARTVKVRGVVRR